MNGAGHPNHPPRASRDLPSLPARLQPVVYGHDFLARPSIRPPALGQWQPFASGPAPCRPAGHPHPHHMPKIFCIANQKGGVGKTMTTAMLSAVYARVGGGNVLAWDNNDTRGTLGWRTEQGLYDTTLRDLLPEASRLLALGAGAEKGGPAYGESGTVITVASMNPCTRWWRMTSLVRPAPAAFGNHAGAR